MKGTDLQEVFDAFLIKVPGVDFKNKESQIVQFMKSAISKCYRHTYDSLEYEINNSNYTGYFKSNITHPSIELISMFMAKEYFSQKFSVLTNRKQYMGTQAFNKIPANIEEFNLTKGSLEFWEDEIRKFLMEFPDYSEER